MLTPGSERLGEHGGALHSNYLPAFALPWYLAIHRRFFFFFLTSWVLMLQPELQPTRVF